jgi:IPT/TIG domain-containing protein
MPKSLNTLAVLTFSLWLMACGESPASVTPDSTEIVMLQGDGQFAPAQQRLPEMLRVVVRSTDTHDPIADAVVEFAVVAGAGAALDDRAVVTDEDGIAATGLTLGSEIGGYRIRATLLDAEAAPVEFEAFAVLPPALEFVPGAVTAGEIIEITGQNFSPVAETNVVLFSGVRGRVTASTPTTMSVQVPACLLSRNAPVVVRFGTVSSNVLQTTVAGTDERLELALGGDVQLQESDGSACVTLPGGAEPQRYLLTLQSAGRVGGARYDIGLRGRAAGLVAAPVAPAVPAPSAASAASAVGLPGPLASSTQGAWDAYLRRTEDELARARTSPPSTTGQATAPARVPRLGNSREFEVIGRGSDFKKIRATAAIIGQRAAIYVDDRASDLISEADLERFSDLFDSPIYDAVTGAFGDPSDLDDNDRVIILFTPEVNLLTDRGDDGFVAGFFFGLDLMPNLAKSNGGEIFYMVVPDPSGIYSDPRTTESLLGALPPILAHEFQHMVHFNQRVLIGGGGGTDALWLSEGLATMAEDLVGEAAGPNPTDGKRYRVGNLARVSRFLRDPEAVSLTVTAGSGSLAERGAGWLFVRYLWEHFGQSTVLRGLVRNTTTGIENVEGVTGEPWEVLFSDWAIAVRSEFAGWGGLIRLRHTYPRMDLQLLLRGGPVSGEVEAPRVLSATDFDQTARLWSGGTAQFILTVPAGGALSVNFGAAAGGPLTPSSRLQLRVVRVP